MAGTLTCGNYESNATYLPTYQVILNSEKEAEVSDHSGEPKQTMTHRTRLKVRAHTRKCALVGTRVYLYMCG
jgi:hypothetical protein